MKWEDYEKMAQRYKELQKDSHAHEEEQQNKKDFYGDCDSMWAPEKGGALIIYILAMLFGSIFHARILIWIVSTLIYCNFTSRHDK